MSPDDLKKYVSSNKRLYPKNWAKYLDILEINAGHPCTPLVLGGSDATDQEKRKRLFLQIDYAFKNPKIYDKLKKNLLDLEETDWVYESIYSDN